MNASQALARYRLAGAAGPNPPKVYKRAIVLFTARKSHTSNAMVWEYLATTYASPTCREAKVRACKMFGLQPAQIRAFFKKGQIA